MNGVLSINVFGLQIVRTPATPEPGVLALLTGFNLSGSVFVLRRRRR